MSTDLNQKLLGKWKSDIQTFKNLLISIDKYVLGNDNGRWGTQGNEIWLLNEDSGAGTKFWFQFEGNDKLIFYNPEDFIYQGGTDYIYYQMTPPEKKIIFIRITSLKECVFLSNHDKIRI